LPDLTASFTAFQASCAAVSVLGALSRLDPVPLSRGTLRRVDFLRWLARVAFVVVIFIRISGP
jgi:hypothetical protein